MHLWWFTLCVWDMPYVCMIPVCLYSAHVYVHSGICSLQKEWVNISVWISLLSMGDGDQLSLFEVVEVSASSVSKFLCNTFAHWLWTHPPVLTVQFPFLTLHYFFILQFDFAYCHLPFVVTVFSPNLFL